MVSGSRNTCKAEIKAIAVMMIMEEFRLACLIYGLAEAPRVPMVLTYAYAMDVMLYGNN